MKNYFADLSIQNNCRDEEPSTPASNRQILTPKSSEALTPMPVSLETTAIMGVIEITKESIRCFTEYAKCKEHEITERKRINATLTAVMYQIDAQKEVYLHELKKNYEERNRLYDIVEIAQQKALELGDKEMLQLCYNMILTVYSKPVGNTSGMPFLLNGSNTPF